MSTSTPADANKRRDRRIWENLAKGLIRKPRALYANEVVGLDLENAVYGLDSSAIARSLTLLPWAGFRRTKAGVKGHTQIELRGPIPTCIFVSGARRHDVNWLDDLVCEAGAFYVMDRGEMDSARLGRLAASGAFFGTRAKDNLRFTRNRSLPVDDLAVVRSDHIGEPAVPKSRHDFPWPQRKARYFDAETARTLVFLTNYLGGVSPSNPSAWPGMMFGMAQPPTAAGDPVFKNFRRLPVFFMLDSPRCVSRADFSRLRQKKQNRATGHTWGPKYEAILVKKLFGRKPVKS